MEIKYSTDKIPRFDLRTNKSIYELYKASKKPFRKIQDLHELNKNQSNLFDDMDIETDCFCKAN